MTEDQFQVWLARQNKEESYASSAYKYGRPADSGVKLQGERRSSMNDKELDAFCWAWNQWCYTRKFFIAPGAKNILARMQPSKVHLPPNAAMSGDMSYFNMAVHALADMGDPDTECFVKFYAEVLQDKMPIKTIADKMSIGVRTFYDRKARFARKAISMSASLKKAAFLGSQAQTKESEEID